jgi:hypothetical protein
MRYGACVPTGNLAKSFVCGVAVLGRGVDTKVDDNIGLLLDSFFFLAERSRRCRDPFSSGDHTVSSNHRYREGIHKTRADKGHLFCGSGYNLQAAEWKFRAPIISCFCLQLSKGRRFGRQSHTGLVSGLLRRFFVFNLDIRQIQAI